MKRLYKILLVLMTLGLLVSCKKEEEKVVDYVFLYPEIDDQVLADLENGHHTSYFNRDDLAFEYLEKVYPDKDFKIGGATTAGDTANIDFKEKDGDFRVNLSLEKVDLKGPNETLSIWTVKEIKEH